MSKQISSVDWLLEQLNNKRLGNYEIDIPKNVIEAAKAMHKQEIEEAFKHGKLPPLFVNLTAQDYYNETFEQ